MTKKRKRYPDLNQKLERPWCYYCERDFDDLKILISHQKAKHFKCERCGRRLNTAGGLSVHMNQVHKETLTQVENAISGRQGLDIEIFGMEGVPPEIMDQHNQQVTHKHFEEEQERARVSGNPIRGIYSNGTQAQQEKRVKVKESIDDIKVRAAKFRLNKADGKFPSPVVVSPAPFVQPPTNVPPFAPGAFPPPEGPPGAFPGSAPPPGFAPPPPFGAPSPFPPGPSPPNVGMPPRPGSIPGQPPPFGAPVYPPGPFPPPHVQNGGPPPPSAAISQSVDELISSAAASSTPAPAEPAPEKKSKKDKNIKLIFSDDSISPEEKMAALPRYASMVRT